MTVARSGAESAVLAYDWIAHHNANRGTKEAIRDLGKGASFTYAEIDRRVDALAAYFESVGIGRGDRIAVLAYNGVEFFDVQFACARTGSIFVPLNWRLTNHELAYILKDSSPSLLIHDVSFAEIAQNLQGQCGISELLAIGESNGPNAYEATISQFSSVNFCRKSVTLNDVISIMYTSGTSGDPKGAIITHGMIFWNAVNQGVPIGISPNSVHLCILPLFHTAGMNCFSNPVLHAGGTVVIMKAFDPGDALRVLGSPKHAITHFMAVPAPYQFMMQHPEFENTDLSGLQVAGVGGAPCPVTILQTWARRGVPIMQGFGMTETSPACIFLAPAEALRKIGSAGKALMHTEVRIVNEKGSDCGAEEIGELWVAGPNITPGYWNRPDASAEAFVGRWFKTGDAARADADGFFYIVDRWKDMFISGGENVYPAEVENVIYQLPQISEVAVIGMPDEKWGEVGLAVVSLKPGHTIDQKALLAHCLNRLARFKIPGDFVIVDALPRNATGKVLKRELRSHFLSSSVSDVQR
jgi:fatty-acyl-CoA synthase